MQLQHPFVVGSKATANGGFAVYNALFMHCIADATISEGDCVIWDTVLSSDGLLGHSVIQSAGASALMCGVADADAVAGESLLVQCGGIADMKVTASITTSGEAVMTAASGEGTDHDNTLTTAEDVLEAVGVSLEGEGSDGKALVWLRCM